MGAYLSLETISRSNNVSFIANAYVFSLYIDHLNTF